MKGFINLFVLVGSLLVVLQFGLAVPAAAQVTTEKSQSQPPGSKRVQTKSVDEARKPKRAENQQATGSPKETQEKAKSEKNAKTDQNEPDRLATKNQSQKDKIREQLRIRCKDIKPRIELILKYYFQQKEYSTRRSPWGLMHAMVAFGPYAEMYGDGKLVKDVDWLCQNGIGRQWKLLKLEKGNLATNHGPGRQGHDGQFLAILAQSQIPKTRELLVDGREFTIEDLIEYEKKTCRPRTELTFKLIGLSHYIDSDTKWRGQDGRIWNLERIIREELKQPINGAACGGTHRLMGYSYSLLMRKLQNKPIQGDWKRADDFVSDFRGYTLSMQNRDGSFSTDWFKSRQARRDSQRRVQTTGHILEWLVFSATEEELADPRLIRAVDYLSKLMWNERTTEWEVGPKGHAVRALRLFYERVLADPTPQVADADAREGEIPVRPFYQR